MKTSEKTGKLMIAIRAVQAALPIVAKDSTVKIESRTDGARVEHFASHHDAWGKLQPLCETHRLTVTQDGTQGANGSQWLTTRITWTSADGEEEQWKEGDILVASPRPGFRDFGAFWSYNRRIALLAAFGIVAGGDEPDQREADKVKEATPPRAERGARPAGRVDPEAESSRVLRELAELPDVGTTKATIDALAKQLRGMSFDPATEQRIGDAFAAKRKALGFR